MPEGVDGVDNCLREWREKSFKWERVSRDDVVDFEGKRDKDDRTVGESRQIVVVNYDFA